jgi:hypothetical protein
VDEVVVFECLDHEQGEVDPAREVADSGVAPPLRLDAAHATPAAPINHV